MEAILLYLVSFIAVTRGDSDGLNENGCPTDYTIDKLMVHENCDQYYQCLNGVPIARICPSGLHFNPQLEKCDWPAEAKCTNNQEDLNDIPIKRMRPFEHLEQSEQSDELDNTNPNHAISICATTESNNVLVAHEHCNHFYKCSFGKPIVLKCAKNLLYNPVNEKCDLPPRVECGDRNIPGKEETDKIISPQHKIINRSRSGEKSVINFDPFDARTTCERPGSDGILVPHAHCDHYYKCYSNQPIVMKCPINLLYNHIKKYCDWPRNVYCGDRTVTDAEPTQSLPNNNDLEGEDNSSSGEGSEEVNNNNIIYTDPNQAPVICATPNSEGVFIAHEKCNKFYKCAGGHPVALLCPDDLLYNPNKEYCDWPHVVECGDRTLGDKEENSSESDESENLNVDEFRMRTGNHSDPSQAPSICASPGSDGVLVAHENCNQFYKCHDGLPVALKCPATLLYNSSKEYCDWSYNVDCGDRTITENDNEIDNGSDDSLGASNNHSDPSEAPSICATEKSDGIFVAHSNCNQFYKCYDGKPVAFFCQLNLLYNPVKEFCDWPRNVDCGTRHVPELIEFTTANNSGEENSETPYSCVGKPDGDIVPNEHCSQFSKCVGGIPQATDCAPGLYYNTVLKVCDWPMNVNCGNRVTEAQTMGSKHRRNSLSFLVRDFK